MVLTWLHTVQIFIPSSGERILTENHGLDCLFEVIGTTVTPHPMLRIGKQPQPAGTFRIRASAGIPGAGNRTSILLFYEEHPAVLWFFRSFSVAIFPFSNTPVSFRTPASGS